MPPTCRPPAGPAPAAAFRVFRSQTNDLAATLSDTLTAPPVPALVPDLLALLRPAFVLGSVQPAAGSGSATGPLTADNSDQAVGGPAARSMYGVTGAGIKVGILSDSFNLLGGMAADVADGNLPANVQILQEGPPGGHDEGRAMADLIHRIAPGAQLFFHTATAGQADFAAGITALVAAGCNVVVDDVAYLNAPFFQNTGAVDAAITQAIAAGVSYVTAAGNEGQDYIQMAFAAMHLTLPGLPPGALVQNFATPAAPQPWLDITIPPQGVGILDLQWNQPFVAAASPAGSADSLGMALFDSTGAMVATAGTDMTGGNPDQVLQFTNASQQSRFRLVLWANGGAVPPGLFKIISYGNGSIASAAGGQGSGSVIGQEMLPAVNTVGAMAWSATPGFGGSNLPERFSSVGTGTFLFDSSGTRLAQPQSAAKVDFLAPDGSVTSVLAPFYGTSAAAANAAGVAALVLQADPALTPAQVTQVLEQSALPAGGSALATGAGLIQAPAAVQLALSLRGGMA